MPLSWKENMSSSVKIRWSTSWASMLSRARATRQVASMSPRLGAGLPLGWLWASTTCCTWYSMHSLTIFRR